MLHSDAPRPSNILPRSFNGSKVVRNDNSTFHRFRDLPVEIRELIIEYCIHQQTVHLKLNKDGMRIAHVARTLAHGPITNNLSMSSMHDPILTMPIVPRRHINVDTEEPAVPAPSFTDETHRLVHQRECYAIFGNENANSQDLRTHISRKSLTPVQRFRTRDSGIAILRTSKQFYHEALRVLYKQTLFMVGGDAPFDLRDNGYFYVPEPGSYADELVTFDPYMTKQVSFVMYDRSHGLHIVNDEAIDPLTLPPSIVDFFTLARHMPQADCLYVERVRERRHGAAFGNMDEALWQLLHAVGFNLHKLVISLQMGKFEVTLVADSFAGNEDRRMQYGGERYSRRTAVTVVPDSTPMMLEYRVSRDEQTSLDRQNRGIWAQ